MSIANVNLGLVANDGTGDSIRSAFQTVNNNVYDLDYRFNSGNLAIVRSSISITGQSIVSNTSVSAQSLLTTTITATGNAIVGGYMTVAEDALFTRNVIITGNLAVLGNSMTINSTDLSVTDSIINIHTPANLLPLTIDDGKDIGLAFHYYRGMDKHAALVWANDSQALEFYADGSEGIGNIWTGTYGNVKIGSLYVGNTTLSTSTTTGAVIVKGGLGVSGNATITTANITQLSVTGTVVGSMYLTGTDTVFINGSPVSTSAGSFTGGIVPGLSTFTTGIISNGQLFANSLVASTNTTTGALRVAGGVGVSGAIYAGSIQNTPIGATTASTGRFTSLSVTTGVITANTAVIVSGTNSNAVASTSFVQSEKEYLPLLSQSLHYGAVVKSIIYDTANDSDGGAWRKRCTDLSWYTETLGGTVWTGQRASNSAAWTAAGSVVGSYYQSTADGKYYTPTSTSTQTEVFRGNAREFPAEVAIVAETARVIIYDLTQVGCPMWMVFIASASASVLTNSPPVTSAAMLNGQLLVSMANGGLFRIVYPGDTAYRYHQYGNTTGDYGMGLVNRNIAYAYNANLTPIISGDVNDVAMTVLDNAPIDPGTGLPTPTVAIATAGGVSVIKDDGSVVNNTNTIYGGVLAVTVEFDVYGNLYVQQQSDHARFGVALKSNYSVYAFIGGDSVTGIGLALPRSPVTGSHLRFHPKGALTIGGLLLSKINFQSPSNSMFALISNLYNTGWMIGDNRGAYLSDTIAGSLSAPELVVNGTFASGTTGWSIGTGATLSAPGGELLVQAAGLSYGAAVQSFATVIGARYTVSAIARLGTATLAWLLAGTAAQGLTYGAQGITLTSNAVVTITFTATTTTTYISIQTDNTVSGGTVYADNISCKQVEVDRSARANHLQISGTLTKAAVATSASLVSYSGFSTANYLTQPYSTNWDFGLNGFDISAWVNVSATTATIAATIAASPSGLGPEQVLDGTGGSQVNWSSATGTVSVFGGELVNTGLVEPYPEILQDIPTNIGRTYLFSVNLRRGTSANGAWAIVKRALGASQLGATPVIMSTTSTYAQFCFTALDSSIRVSLVQSAAIGDTGTVLFDNVSVREVVGVLPIVSRAKLLNQVTYSSDFSNAAWTKIQMTTTANSLSRSSTAAAYVNSSILADLPVGSIGTGVVLAKPKSLGNAIGVRLTGAYPDRVDAVFNLTTGTLIGVATGGTYTNVSASIAGPDINGYYLCAVSGMINTTAGNALIFGPCEITASYGGWEGGSSVLSDCYVGGAGVVVGQYTALQLLAMGGIPPTTSVPTPAGPLINMGINAYGQLAATVHDGFHQARTAVSTSVINTGMPTKVSLTYEYSYDRSHFIEVAVNNVTTSSVYYANDLFSLDNSTAVVTVGTGLTLDQPFPGSIALLNVSATAPTSDQQTFVYKTELPLFSASAKCIIDGTTSATTALAYDSVTETMHVGTSWGRSAFKNLLRVDSEATTIGAITALSANQGAILQGGTTAKFYQPAIVLRDELRRKDEARRALGRIVVGQDFTATYNQTEFVCLKGYDVRFVYVNGLLKRYATDYSVSSDGFQSTVYFYAGINTGVPVTIMITRS